MKKNIKHILLTLVFLLITAVILLITTKKTAGLVDKINNLVSFITLLALFWYSYETRGMKKEMIAQTEIEQKPAMTLLFNSINDCFELENNGKGTAYNVKVGVIKIDNNEFDFYFDDSNSLVSSSEKKELKIIAKHTEGNKEALESDGVGFFRKALGEKAYENMKKDDFRDLSKQAEAEFTISYKNAYEKNYETIFVVCYSGIMPDRKDLFMNDFNIIFKK